MQRVIKALGSVQGAGEGEGQESSRKSLRAGSCCLHWRCWHESKWMKCCEMQTCPAWGRGEGQKCTMAGDRGAVRGRWLWAGRAAVHTQGFCTILLVSALDATTPVRYGESHCPSTSEDFFFQSLPIASGVTKLQYSYCNIKRQF